MIIANNRIAVTPYPTTDIKIEIRGGLPRLKQRKELTLLKVVYPSSVLDLMTGASVWVRGDSCKLPHATEVFETEEGVPFVLLPNEFIVSYKQPPTESIA